MERRKKIMKFGLAMVIVSSFSFAWWVDTLKGALCRRPTEGTR